MLIENPVQEKALEFYVDKVISMHTKLLCAKHQSLQAVKNYRPGKGHILVCGCVRPTAPGTEEPPIPVLLRNRTPWTSTPYGGQAAQV